MSIRGIRFRGYELKPSEGYKMIYYSSLSEAGQAHTDTRLTQYTKIKDIKQKDIYEGDRLQDMNSDVYTIEYRQAGFFAVQHNRTIFALGIDNVQHLRLEVIGNIYESEAI